MKKYFFVLIVTLFLLVPVFRVTAQTTLSPVLVSTTFDMTGFPQWTKDIRRWEIVAFGTFPFTFLISTMAVDTYYWGTKTGFSFSSEGLSHAPWPIKGPVTSDSLEYRNDA